MKKSIYLYTCLLCCLSSLAGLQAVRAQCLSGTYTIGGVSPGYATITAAVADLKAKGVCGPVTFRIRSGTYNEQLVVYGDSIAGISQANRLTFVSEKGNADSVVIAWAGTSSDETNNQVCYLGNAVYVTLKQLSFKATGTGSFVLAMRIYGNLTGIRIDSCRITGKSPGPTSLPFASLVYTRSLTGNNFVFSNNLLEYGSAPLYLDGVQTGSQANDIVIRNNTIRDYGAQPGVSFRFIDKAVCENNILSTRLGSGITFLNSDSAIRCVGNKVYVASSRVQTNAETGAGYGLGIISCNYNDSGKNPRGTIANNVITNGMTLFLSNGQDIYNNSIYATGTNKYTMIIPAHSFDPDIMSRGNVILNNLLYNEGGRTALATAIFPPGINRQDYNLYYSTTGNLVESTLGGMTSIADWKTASGLDSHSVSYRPPITDTVSLAPIPADSAAWALNGRGVHIPGNNKDINDSTRPDVVTAGAPDIGAYELTPVSVPPAAIAYPASASPGVTQAFVFAGDTVANITWSAVSAIPADIRVRQYSGEIPPQYGSTSPRMYFYTDISATGSQSYSYTAETFYRSTWLGTNPSETRLKLQRKAGAAPWKTWSGAASTVDTVRKVLVWTGAGLTDFALHTGTDSCNVQPEKIDGDTAVCSGKPYTYSVTDIGCAATYTWTLPGGWTGSSTSSTITVTPGTAGGSIGVSVSLPYGGSVSQTLAVTVYTPPSATISKSGTTLSVSGGFTGYQWYRDGQAIAGATTQSHTATEDGDYYAGVVDGNGCSANSDTVTVTDFAGITVTDAGHTLRIYPNPAGNWFVINTGQLQIQSVKVYNAIGKIVSSDDRVQQGLVMMATDRLANGIYLVEVQTRQGICKERVHIMR